MRSPTKTARLIGASAALLVATTLTSSPAEAAPPSPEKSRAGASSVSSTSPLTAEAKAAGKKKFGAKATHDQALAAYWTPERMRAAKPIEETKAFKKAAKEYAADQQKRRKAGKKPVTNDGPVRSVEGTESAVFGGPSTAAYNPNLPYYSPTAYTNGKVFFTRGGGSFACSGSIINTEGKNAVWTAGHCVHGGKGSVWHSNWTFVPAYDDDLANPRPYGTWSARFLSSRTAWTNNSDFSQDIGVATMNTRNGWRIADYFGGQGFTVNRGKNVYEYAFGYPGEWPFDGGNLMRCQGGTSPEWDYWFTWSQTLKISCDMTRGSSGGPWLYGYNGNWGYLNGVNSRIDRILNPTIMLSPYFDNDAWSLYNYTRYN